MYPWLLSHSRGSAVAGLETLLPLSDSKLKWQRGIAPVVKLLVPLYSPSFYQLDNCYNSAGVISALPLCLHQIRHPVPTSDDVSLIVSRYCRYATANVTGAKSLYNLFSHLHVAIPLILCLYPYLEVRWQQFLLSLHQYGHVAQDHLTNTPCCRCNKRN